MATIVLKKKSLKPCPLCSKSFNGDQGVRVHIARAHQEVPSTSKNHVPFTLEASSLQPDTKDSTQSSSGLNSDNATTHSHSTSSLGFYSTHLDEHSIQQSLPSPTILPTDHSDSQTFPKELLRTEFARAGNSLKTVERRCNQLPEDLEILERDEGLVLNKKVLKPCPICHKHYNGDHGVRVHISRTHQEVSRNIAAEKYALKSAVNIPKPLISHFAPKLQTGVKVNQSRSIHPVTPATPILTSTVNGSEARLPTRTSDLAIDQIRQVRQPDPMMLNFCEELIQLLEGERNTQALDSICVRIQEYLAKAIDILPGPKHPASKFYYARKKKEPKNKSKGYSSTSNPQRDRKKRSEKSKEQYMYEKVQYEYYNRRRKAWRSIVKNNPEETCAVPIAKVQDHFERLLSSENPSCRPSYEPSLPCDTEAEYLYSEADIVDAMKGISIDTAPGSDRVIMRAIKELSAATVLSLVATLMEKWTHVPASLKIARSVLIHKSGDASDLNNWRPIMIFSIVRRIIERAIEKRVRKIFQPCAAQRGFVATPGAHINSSLVNGVLHAAKQAGKNCPSSPASNCTIIFLDVAKAFDNISHDHIRKSLESLPLSQKQRDLLLLLISENTVQIGVNRKKTKMIPIRRGVPQGAPLSPTLFNIAIDFILKDLTEDTVARNHGYEIVPSEKPISGLGFADDTTVIGKSKESALVLTQIVIDGLRQIGLAVNCRKSKGIVIENGELQPNALLQTLNGDVISTLQTHERVKYLGINFEDEIILDEAAVIGNINENLNLLVATPLLKPSQKQNIINQFIWPSVVYPLQCAPLKNLTKGFLKDIDIGIRGAVKQILTIPNDSPDGMLYAPRKLRGLGIVCASWEAYLQHYSICCKLEKIEDPVLSACRNFVKEKQECLHHLNIDLPDNAIPTQTSTQKLRSLLRNSMFKVWCELPSKGQGVILFAEYPQANAWMATGEGLSSSQWTTAVKMNANCCSTRGTKGRFAGPDSCRYPNCMKKETLCHVLQNCPHSNEVVIARHNHVVDIIETALKLTGYEVHKEVHCVDGNGNKRADLVVLDRRASIKDSLSSTSRGAGYIIDPTIRFEKNSDQAQEVHLEKCTIYDPTHEYFKTVYPDIQEWTTIGLFIGSRGTITKFFVENLIKKFGLPKNVIKDIVRSVISDSVSILNFHLFSGT